MNRLASSYLSAITAGTLILVLAITAIGCSAPPNPAMLGLWKIGTPPQVGTLALRPDGSFTLVSSKDHIDGTWKSDGSELTLFRDIRNEDPSSFGDGWNDSYHFYLEKGNSELVAKNNAPNFPSMVFKRAKG